MEELLREVMIKVWGKEYSPEQIDHVAGRVFPKAFLGSLKAVEYSKEGDEATITMGYKETPINRPHERKYRLLLTEVGMPMAMEVK
jgi:hypothetical protein